MKRHTIFIAANAVIFGIVAHYLTHPTPIKPRPAVAGKLRGAVWTRRGGSSELDRLQPGATIQPGDVIETGTSGTAEVRWPDGTRCKVAPNSQVRLRKSSIDLNRRQSQMQLQVRTGQVLVCLGNSLSPARCDVETPTAVVTSHDGSMGVDVSNGTTQVAVCQGQAQVSSPGLSETQGRTLAPGEAVQSVRSGSLQDTSAARLNRQFAHNKGFLNPDQRSELPTPDDSVAIAADKPERPAEPTDQSSDPGLPDAQPPSVETSQLEVPLAATTATPAPLNATPGDGGQPVTPEASAR